MSYLADCRAIFSAANTLVKSLPSAGHLALGQGFTKVGSTLLKVAEFKPTFAALALGWIAYDGHRNRSTIAQDRVWQGIFAAEVATNLLVLVGAGLNVSQVRSSNPVVQAMPYLLGSATVASRSLKTKKASERLKAGEGKLEITSHLLRISAVFLSWTWSSRLKQVGHVALLIGAAGDLWLIGRNRKKH